jgi:hypothetical protein
LVEVVTLLDGEMLTVESTGAVLLTETVALPESLPLSASFAVTVHLMVSLGEAVLLVSVRVALEPRLVDPLVQA